MIHDLLTALFEMDRPNGLGHHLPCFNNLRSNFPSRNDNPSKNDDNNPSSPSAKEVVSKQATFPTEEVDCSQVTLTKLTNLFLKGKMCDVCLMIGEKEFLCHRLILSAYSNVFKTMLNDSCWTEAASFRISLVDPPECVDVFPLFLQFFYSGKVTFNLPNVLPFYLLADKYDVVDLMTRCRNFMMSNIAPAAAVGYLTQWMQHNVFVINKAESKTFHDFLAWNICLLASVDGIKVLNEQILLALLQRSDLVVHDESTLYRLVVHWLEEQEKKHSEEEMMEIMARVLPHIRFPMMTPDQSQDLLICPLAHRNREFFMNRMSLNLLFHRGSAWKTIEEWMGRRGCYEQFMPRIYTANDSSSLVTVENFSKLPRFHVTTLLFTSSVALAQHEGTSNCEWVVDVYSKGIRIKGCYLITYGGKIEVPGTIRETVRMTITCRDPQPCMHSVQVSVLVYVCNGGIEYVQSVTQRTHGFTSTDRVLHIDDFIPFHLLNPDLSSLSSQPAPFTYMVGPEKNMLKLRVVITPVLKACLHH